jgi:hypothetical protein
VGALVMASAIVDGCTSVAGSTPASLVRVLDASYNAPALDAYVLAAPIAVNVIGPSVSNYAYAGQGAVTIKLDATGTTNVIDALTGTFAANSQYSIFVADEGKSYTATLLADQSAPAPTGDVAFRFLQQAHTTGNVNVYIIPDGTEISTAKPLFTALAPGAVTKYVDLPAADYDIAIVPTTTVIGKLGVTPTTVYIGSGTTYAGGQVRTVLILDSQLLNAPPATVLIANDVN